MIPCRLIVDPPQDGPWNMAVDEALLDAAADRGEASLRFYHWSEPTLSLGYFQPYNQRLGHEASRAAAAVRRLSGGGALLHDRELTYSLCLPAGHPLAQRSAEMYDAVHLTLIGALSALNLSAALHRDEPGAARRADGGEEPFLCFSRRTAADVVLRRSGGEGPTAKIVGSAQRRRRGAVLQHGAVLLSASSIAPELKGIEELTGATIDPAALAERWQAAVADKLQLQLRTQPLDEPWRDQAHRLCVEKYARDSWTKRR